MRRPVKYDLLRDDDRLFQVLWCEAGGSRLAVLETSRSTGWPKFWDIENVLDDLDAGALFYEAETVALDVRHDKDITPRHIIHRDEAWRLIQTLVKDEPAVYVKSLRCKYMDEIVKEHDITWNTLVRYLQRYWRNGMTKNALLPRFNVCGAPGRRRADTTTRRGRPRREGHPQGLNTTQEHRHYFSLAI